MQLSLRNNSLSTRAGGKDALLALYNVWTSGEILLGGIQQTGIQLYFFATLHKFGHFIDIFFHHWRGHESIGAATSDWYWVNSRSALSSIDICFLLTWRLPSKAPIPIKQNFKNYYFLIILSINYLTLTF